MTPLSVEAVLATRGLTKSFSGPPVVRDVDLDLRPGEVHALVGENGAGKSTFLRMLAGVHRQDRGQILLDGAPVEVSSPSVAQSYGLALISQEPMLFPDLSVAENIVAGEYPVARPVPWVRWGAMYLEAQELLESIGSNLDARQRVGGLSVAQQQMVEIATALARRARIVLMDEPTASLSPREVDRLFGIVRTLIKRGASVVFVNHRLEEVFTIANRITILRDGAKVGTFPTSEITRDEVVRRMVGRDLVWLYDKPPSQAGPVVLEVEHLTRRGVFHDVSFHVRRGEIVSLAGLVGAGRSEVARAIFGVDPPDRGTVRVDGQPVRMRSPREALQAGLAYLPEDRQHQGLVLPLSVAQNITLSILREVTRLGWLRTGAEEAIAGRLVERLQVKTDRVAQPVEQLSGGNQQKVLVGKYLVTHPKVLILDEPTRGVDIGAKAEIHRLMGELAQQGLGILMISSELPEVLAMADRILVLREGRLVKELSPDEATEETVMRAAVGALDGVPEGTCGAG
ncbi:sugar ABC transporter ATP-binding protein [Limnochorda pilosa]|uniref:D-ribose transporter ATP-binding protein n=1 Tax=Limnochorda pilosa TaxID=1555112 RepID=A0A0K2SH96_LIMPI|nr:sugar ABC transporter ATP-binding protein [Limnochorda pilosa]BAS26412.1 D-ribose transporter ATP-binding protein [Limnochorda pilosa]